ncbi:hypothetical protein [Vibrio vulnificus]|uniref:hypothetical protein n=1 Tax=Vibrio vulnificus TaxID=672 RepID=UPI000CD2A0BE|nr:hypothetical protein [Vibrio vulnificus]EHZ2549490.1 hypothetical protein [Vibrio vulnificus]EIN9355489.1 hypothetical protein [Vibrio vulnificus]MBN8140939.1 hypothetical protein [Vibrio vulnificus]MBN8150160.1 hypothetical protein [Vibrio vulnificus]MCA3963590.1 hypothetical protein [Vibrio vulnificus]
MTTQINDITVATSSESLVKYQSAMDAISDTFFTTYEEETKSLSDYKEQMRLKIIKKTNEKVAPSEAD